MTDEQAVEVTALCRKLRVPDGPKSRAFGLIATALAARERAVWLEAEALILKNSTRNTSTWESDYEQSTPDYLAKLCRQQAEGVGR